MAVEAAGAGVPVPLISTSPLAVPLPLPLLDNAPVTPDDAREGVEPAADEYAGLEDVIDENAADDEEADGAGGDEAVAPRLMAGMPGRDMAFAGTMDGVPVP